jgi:hypothetical protein
MLRNFLVAFLNSFLYNFEGTTNKINVREGEINDIKYSAKYKDGFRADFIQPDVNEMIKRGVASITRMIELITKCLC